MLILHQRELIFSTKCCKSICRFYHLYNFTWNHYVEISVYYSYYYFHLQQLMWYLYIINSIVMHILKLDSSCHSAASFLTHTTFVYVCTCM